MKYSKSWMEQACKYESEVRSDLFQLENMCYLGRYVGELYVCKLAEPTHTIKSL